jgi:DNA ligase 1
MARMKSWASKLRFCRRPPRVERLLAMLVGLLLGVLLAHPLRADDANANDVNAGNKVRPPELLHAETYHAASPPAAFNVAQYWVSEKLDGVRAIWDGRQLRFRSGLPIQAPGWFTQGFTLQAMDGELWLSRGQFDRLSGIVRQAQPDDAAWREVKYMLFDLPGAPGTFTERIAAMQALTATLGQAHLQVLKQERMDSTKALQTRLDEVVQQGGEGLMLHRADALYRVGRTGDLLKYKPWEDAEAVVVEHLPGKGKYAGQIGALRVRLADGRLLRIGSGLTDVQRRNPPPLGALVTYRYRGMTSHGLPRFATFLRVRELQ